MQRIIPHLWFDDKAEEAVSFYVSVFKNSRIVNIMLAEGGDEKAQQCGWLKDKYGLSWQIVPAVLEEMLQDKVPARSEKVMEALLKMKKIEIEALKKAHGSLTK